MQIIVNIENAKFPIFAGDGSNQIRWLAMTSALQFKMQYFPHEFKLPYALYDSKGNLLSPRSTIKSVLTDGEEVLIKLRKGFEEPDDAEIDDLSNEEWSVAAYGPNSHFMRTQFFWPLPPTNSSENEYSTPIPDSVVGEYTPDPKWKLFYSNLPTQFEIPLAVNEKTMAFSCSLMVVPGTVQYRYRIRNGADITSKLVSDPVNANGFHERVITWDNSLPENPIPENEYGEGVFEES